MNELAIRFADFIFNEIGKQGNEPMTLMDLFAVDKRKEVWKAKGLYAAGPGVEILTALYQVHDQCQQ